MSFLNHISQTLHNFEFGDNYLKLGLKVKSFFGGIEKIWVKFIQKNRLNLFVTTK